LALTGRAGQIGRDALPISEQPRGPAGDARHLPVGLRPRRPAERAAWPASLRCL